MSPSPRGSAAARIEVDPEVLLRAGAQMRGIGASLNALSTVLSAMLGSGIASGFDPAGLNFGMSYGDSAQEFADALADAATSFNSVGMMLESSGYNYKNADAASTIGGSGPTGGVSGELTKTKAGTAPSGPSGINTPPPTKWHIVQPFLTVLPGIGLFAGAAMTWPSGVPPLLGVTAAQWKAIATGLSSFDGVVDGLKASVSGQDIPEKGKIDEAFDDLGGRLKELGPRADVIATSVKDFGAGVQETQDAIRRLLDRISLDGIIDTITGFFTGEAEDIIREVANDIGDVLGNFQDQVKGVVGLLGQLVGLLNDAATAFQKWIRPHLTEIFGDDLGNAIADAVTFYTDFQVGLVTAVINTVASTVALADPDTWKGMLDVAQGIIDDPSTLDDVLVNMGKEFVAWDEWSGDHPGRAAGQAAFNIGSLFVPGGALTKTGTLAKGLSYGSRLAREGRGPRISDIPGLGNRHTPSLEGGLPGAGRGLPDTPEFTPGRVPDSLTPGPTAPNSFDPPSTPQSLGGPPDPPGPNTTPSGGDSGSGGGDGPPGAGGRPVGPPDSSPGPSTHSPSSTGPGSVDSPRTSEPSAPSTPGHSSSAGETAPPASQHAPESSSPTGTHDTTPTPTPTPNESATSPTHQSPSDTGTSPTHPSSGGHSPTSDAPSTGHTPEHRADTTQHQPAHTPTNESTASHERSTAPHERSTTTAGEGRHSEPASATPGVMSGGGMPMTPHTPGGTPGTPDGSSSAGKTPSAESPARSPEAKTAQTPESPRAPSPSASGPAPGNTSAAPVHAGNPSSSEPRLRDPAAEPRAASPSHGDSPKGRDPSGSEPPAPVDRTPTDTTPADEAPTAHDPDADSTTPDDKDPPVLADPDPNQQHSYPLPPASAVTPPHDGAFFWSGRDADGVGVGPDGSNSAGRIAETHDGTTLEGLLERNGIEPPKWSPNDPAAERWWSDVSDMYAQNTSGEVRAVVGSQLRPDNIWQNVELPRLMENPNVTRITEIDAETGRETEIFNRSRDGDDGHTPPPGDTSPSAAEHPPQSGDPPDTHEGSPGDLDGNRGDGPDDPPASTDPQGVENDGRDPASSDRPDDVCNGDSEPVNLATGEYYLPATDVHLPGVLPLQLSRIHKSQYRHGVWMGPTWSCTFDTRLVVTPDTVSTIDADGAILSFDHPSADQPAVARTGRKWSLTATPSGGYRLHTPDSAVTWHFEPKPQLAGADTAAGVIFVSAITDVHRNSLQFTYTDAGAPSAVISSSGYRIGVDSRGGRIRSYTLATDSASTVLRRFSYTDGDLSAVTDATGATTRFDYDDRHRMVSWTDSIGASYANTYDERGRVIAQSGADGVWAGRFTYADNRSGLTTTYTDGVGNTTTFAFDADMRPTAVTNPAGAVLQTEFTATREPVRSIDPTGATTTISYTDDGLPRQTVDPLGRITTMAYVSTPAGPRLAQMLDPAGGVVSFGYDAAGNRVSIRDADGAHWRWEYTATGAVSARIDPLGRRTEYRVNAAGLPVTVVEPSGGVTQLTYNALGNLIAAEGPDGAGTRMAYDTAGRMVSRTAPDGATESWAYDGEGNRVGHTDTAGATTRWEYGFFDLPVARIDADGSRTVFDYDRARRLVRVTNPAGLTWRYRYHADGTLAAQTDFNDATTTYTYDAAGRIASRTNAAGQTVTYEYDAAGQLVAESSVGGDFSGERIAYSYDPVGRTTSVEMPWATVSLGYDAAGRVVAEDVDGRTVVSEYNPAGELVSRRTPSGVLSELSYDDSGGVSALVTAGTRCAVSNDAYGRAARMRFGGAAIDSAWDSAGRLALRQVLGGAGVEPDRLLAAARFAYGAEGLLSSVSAIDPAAPVLGTPAAYGTDAMGRLVSRRTADGLEQTAFDAAQNPTITVGAEQLRWRYRATLLIDDGRSRYRYDEAGRVVQVVTRRLSRGPDVWKYRWDAWDRLRSVTTPDGRVHHYTYDSAGRRLSKRTDNGRIDFAWAGDRLVEQTTASTTTSWSYQPGHITPYGQIHSAAGDLDDIDRRFFAIVTDQIEAPVALVDPVTGEIAGHAESSMWGATRWTGVATPWRYPGQYHDPETGLHYNRHRYYQPGAGRYLSPDPLGLAPAPNPYGYPSNPTALFDPFGLAPCGGAPAAGTVWDHVTPTQPNYPGTPIPQSFTLDTGHGSFWIHGNATEHLSEFANSLLDRGHSTEYMRTAVQAQMTSLRSTLGAISESGFEYGNMLNMNGWEIIIGESRIPNGLPTVFHALHR